MAGMITSPTTIGSKGLSDFHTDFTPTSEGIYPTHSIKGDITTVMSDAQFGAGIYVKKAHFKVRLFYFLIEPNIKE